MNRYDNLALNILVSVVESVVSWLIAQLAKCGHSGENYHNIGK